MIRVKELIVNYKDVRALDKISLTINRGESVALVGRNGAGKSSLLKSIIGIIKPYSGDIQIDGSIGWMPEKGYLEDNIKVFEHLEHISYLKGVEKTLIIKEVHRVLNLCELSNKRDSYCKELSKGEMQRIHLASAIINSPDILILDEPSSGFDPLFQQKMINIIKEASKDKVLIVSTHNIHEIENLTTKVIVLKEGQVSLINSMDESDSYRVTCSGSANSYPNSWKQINNSTLVVNGSSYMDISKSVMTWAENFGIKILDIKKCDDWSRLYDYF